MWSSYLRTRKKGDVVAIFHELHPDPVFCSLEQWNRFLDENFEKADNYFNEFLEKKLIIENIEEDLIEFNQTARDVENKFDQPIILYLMLSSDCNFSCCYCPFSKRSDSEKSVKLSLEDSKAGVDLWQKHLQEKYDPSLQHCIIFYGGEPLLNRRVLKETLEYAKNKIQLKDLPENINFLIATNGSLIDKEFISICRFYDVSVMLGLDGIGAVNDFSRVDSDNKETFSNIINSIKNLVDNKIKVFVSTIITPLNIDCLSYYSSFLKNIGVEQFGFNFLKGKGLLKMVGKENVKSYYEKSSRLIIDNAIKSGYSNFEYQIEKKRKAFEDKTFYPVDCTCYGNQLVIKPGGFITNCPFYEKNITQFSLIDNDFRIWNQQIVKEWRKEMPIYQIGEAKAIDGGGCRWNSIETSSEFFDEYSFNKIFAEEVLDEFIWNRYNKLSL